MLDVLTNILYSDRETAIGELSQFKKLVSPSEFKSLTKQLSHHQRATLVDINASEVNRRDITRHEGFKLGDRVRVRYEIEPVYTISRGHTRRSGRRGRRRLFYISQYNLQPDRIFDCRLNCPYPSLVDKPLTIVEFYSGWVVCIRPGGSYSPALLPEDLELCPTPELNGKTSPYSSEKSESNTNLKAVRATSSSSRLAMASIKS